MLLRQAIRDTIERSVHAEDKDMFESLLSSMFPHSDADMDVVDYLPHLGPLRPQIELGRRLVEKYKASRIGSPDDVTAYSEPSDQVCVQVLAAAMKQACGRLGLQVVPGLVDEVADMYTSMESQHSVALIGKAMSCKTTILRVLQEILSPSIQNEPPAPPPVPLLKLNTAPNDKVDTSDKVVEAGRNTEENSLVPAVPVSVVEITCKRVFLKTLSVSEALGWFDLASQNWVDGAFTTLIRNEVLAAADMPELMGPQMVNISDPDLRATLSGEMAEDFKKSDRRKLHKQKKEKKKAEKEKRKSEKNKIEETVQEQLPATEISSNPEEFEFPTKELWIVLDGPLDAQVERIVDAEALLTFTQGRDTNTGCVKYIFESLDLGQAAPNYVANMGIMVTHKTLEGLVRSPVEYLRGWFRSLEEDEDDEEEEATAAPKLTIGPSPLEQNMSRVESIFQWLAKPMFDMLKTGELRAAAWRQASEPRPLLFVRMFLNLYRAFLMHDLETADKDDQELRTRLSSVHLTPLMMANTGFDKEVSEGENEQSVDDDTEGDKMMIVIIQVYPENLSSRIHLS